jgi:hypothetical protein
VAAAAMVIVSIATSIKPSSTEGHHCQWLPCSQVVFLDAAVIVIGFLYMFGYNYNKKRFIHINTVHNRTEYYISMQ